MKLIETVCIMEAEDFPDGLQIVLDYRLAMELNPCRSQNKNNSIIGTFSNYLFHFRIPVSRYDGHPASLPGVFELQY